MMYDQIHDSFKLKKKIHLSKHNRFHNWTCFGWIVTRLPQIAMSFTWSNIRTKKSSDASWRAKIAVDWNFGWMGSCPSLYKSWTISRRSRWKGSFLINKSVEVWYFRISRRANVPGRYRRFLRGLYPVGLAVVILALVLTIVVYRRGVKINCDLY